MQQSTVAPPALVEEQVASRLLALAQAFGITECQLHGESFDVGLMDPELAGQQPALPSDLVQICSGLPYRGTSAEANEQLYQCNLVQRLFLTRIAQRIPTLQQMYR